MFVLTSSAKPTLGAHCKVPTFLLPKIVASHVFTKCASRPRKHPPACRKRGDGSRACNFSLPDPSGMLHLRQCHVFRAHQHRDTTSKCVVRRLVNRMASCRASFTANNVAFKPQTACHEIGRGGRRVFRVSFVDVLCDRTLRDRTHERRPNQASPLAARPPSHCFPRGRNHAKCGLQLSPSEQKCAVREIGGNGQFAQQRIQIGGGRIWVDSVEKRLVIFDEQ
jgi:hypothetical protein